MTEMVTETRELYQGQPAVELVSLWLLHIYTSSPRPFVTVTFDDEEQARIQAMIVTKDGFWVDNTLYPAHKVDRCVVEPVGAGYTKAFEGDGVA